ncbi:MAG: non-ribosomal peptide synthetase [Candidatus Binatia bacterium]
MDDCNRQETLRAKCFHPRGTFIEFKKDEVEQSVPNRFEQIVRLYPERTAVKFENDSLTYNELNKASNRVARAVLARQEKGNRPIALLFEQSTQVISAILGVLKAGKIYVPLEASDPPARLKSILEDLQECLIITNNKNLALASELADAKTKLISIDTIETLPDEDLRLSLLPDTLAYILYTSGSTGQPKGVVQNHRNILHDCMSYTNNLHICADDRVALFASVCVGASVHYLFGALLNGAGLYPLDIREEGLTRLASWLIQNKITLFQLSTNAFRYFLGTLTGAEDFSDLRLIALGSAQVSRNDVELYKQHFSPDCILLNRLSTTESRTIRWHFIDKQVPNTGDTLPVGYPVEDKEVLLLDEFGMEVGSNEIGEIAVRSRYLAPGYWRRPDLTQVKFLPDPDGGDKRIFLTGDLGRTMPDGCLEHHGRKDFRVKIRGFTVEVNEIEKTLLEHPSIRETTVVAKEDKLGDKRLVAYVVPSQERTPTISELRSLLKAKLPEYMMPATFMMLAALPLTPSGKVNRAALPEPACAPPELDAPFLAPRTPVEEIVAAIWIDALGLARAGVQDNFFDLGGHSLIATKILTAVQNQVQVRLEPRALFDNPTIEDLALTITEALARNSGLAD